MPLVAIIAVVDVGAVVGGAVNVVVAVVAAAVVVVVVVVVVLVVVAAVVVNSNNSCHDGNNLRQCHRELSSIATIAIDNYS